MQQPVSRSGKMLVLIGAAFRLVGLTLEPILEVDEMCVVQKVMSVPR